MATEAGRPGPLPGTAEDDEVTRRQFVGFLTLTSGGLFLATAGVGAAARVRARPAASPRLIAHLEGLPAVSTFAFPGEEERCLLIRLGAERLVAYQLACTHLGCPVVYAPGARALHCPCHEGYFAVDDGRPLAGPPRRPLRRVALAVRDGAVWATEVRSA